MRRLWSKLYFFIFVLAVSGFAFYTYRSSIQEQKDKQEQEKAFPLVEKSQIQEIRILDSVNGSIQLVQRDLIWQLEGAVKDIADTDRVSEWLGDVLDEKVVSMEVEKPDWSEYELDKNYKSIELKSESDQTWKVDVSSYSAFDGKFFLRRGEELLLGETEWASLINKKEKFFRSYKLINTKARAQKINYQSKKHQIHLEMEDYDWKWAEDSKHRFPLSQSFIDNYWSAVSRLRLNDNADIFPQTKSLQEQYKLLKPDIQLDVEFEENSKLSLKLSSKIKDKFYASVSDRNYIFALNEDEAGRILLTPEDFRDDEYPFRFEVDSVHFMELRGNDVNLNLKKDQNQWVLNQNSELELNKEESNQLLRRILDLSAKKYFGNRPFAKKSHLSLKDENNKEILLLEFGDSFELKEGTEELEKMVYVKSSKGIEIMAIELNSFQKIFSSDLLKEKKQDGAITDKKPDKD